MAAQNMYPKGEHVPKKTILNRFPVAWATAVVALLTSGDALLVWQKVLTGEKVTWTTLAIALLTIVLGKLAHGKVTPLADPKAENPVTGELVPLVPKVRVSGS
jgi:hypothetical protein